MGDGTGDGDGRTSHSPITHHPSPSVLAGVASLADNSLLHRTEREGERRALRDAGDGARVRPGAPGRERAGGRDADEARALVPRARRAVVDGDDARADPGAVAGLGGDRARQPGRGAGVARRGGRRRPSAAAGRRDLAVLDDPQPSHRVDGLGGARPAARRSRVVGGPGAVSTRARRRSTSITPVWTGGTSRSRRRRRTRSSATSGAWGRRSTSAGRRR